MQRLAVLLWSMSLSGCMAIPHQVASGPVPASRPAVALAPVPKLRPLFLHLPGIGGNRPLDQNMVHAFQQGGFTGDVQIYDWCGQDAGLKALLETDRDKRQAKIVAAILTARFDVDPTSRIILCCHSAGAGIAVWALEDCPPRVKIATLLFLAPALSPGYDLSNALSHVTGRAYVFSSPRDPVLGFGCRMLGTIDGVKSNAAGLDGFVQPVAADPAEYTKLTPMPYDRTWIYFDNAGDHVGAMSSRFARFALAPLVLEGRLPSTQPVLGSTIGNR